MGETTGISWSDSTFNPWVGCTRVGPACDNCYAATLMEGRWGRVKWGGPGKGVGTRDRTAPSNWSKPVTWNHKAKGKPAAHFVFCASLADVFDNQVPAQWRADLFALIRKTPELTWLLLTKRPQLIVPLSLEAGGLPPNAALGATMVTRAEVDRDAPHLSRAKQTLNPAFTFVSAEPLLDDIAEALRPWMPYTGRLGVDWVITGGESGSSARPLNPQWVRDIRDLCLLSGAAFHHKQNGEWASVSEVAGAGRHWRFPDGRTVRRVGLDRAGRTLDGQVWDGRPVPGAWR